MNCENINLVVTCTARKTTPVPEMLMMRNIRRDRLDRRLDEWHERLRSESVERKRAVDLYCGNSWSVIRELAKAGSSPCRLRIWVISAGHGLVAIEENLTPYAATFASREEDSVIPPELASHSVSEWWGMLMGQRRQAGSSVASVSDIARLHPKTPLVAAISSEYLKAVAHDLQAARSALADSDRLIIISAGARKTGPLTDNFLPCDSRLEHRYGRSRMALNARILRDIVHGFTAENIRASRLNPHFEAMLGRLSPATYPERLQTKDETVRSFIRRGIAMNERCSYTALLRQYRATGRACEQKRFRGLFREMVGDENETKDQK